MAEAAPPALEVTGLSKSFGGARALDGVALTVLPGEVHGLLGENGSGKSTLIKVLAGYHAPDEGELRVRGEDVRLPLPPGRFRELGLSFVHQDLGLVPSLSVVENLRAAELDRIGRPWFVSWRLERRRARAVFARYGVDLRPEEKVASLSPLERALLAIVRAVEGLPDRRGVLVLDEPTVFLPKSDTDRLFGLVRDIAAHGSSIVFVSHDLDEVHEITDRVTVLRDGRVVGTVVTRDTSKQGLVEMIVGRRLDVLRAEHHDLRGRGVGAAVDGLAGGFVRGVSFELREGEILGLTGLAGSGFEDVPYLLFGARPAAAGTLTLGGRRHDLPAISPAYALGAGVVLLPADRQRDGAVGSLSVTDNMTMQVLDRYFPRGVLQRRRMVGHARELCREFDVRPSNPRLQYSSLSGGNQQKAMLAKWLQTDPLLLALHEPTQGVDIGARQQIFEMIRAAAATGTNVLVASSDYEQLAVVCDRVLIFGGGRVVRALEGDDVTKERITEQAYRSAERAGAA